MYGQYVDPSQQGTPEQYNLHQQMPMQPGTSYLDFVQYSPQQYQDVMKTMMGVKYPINRVPNSSQRSPQPQRVITNSPKVQFTPYMSPYSILPQMTMNPRASQPLMTRYDEDDEPLQIAKNRPRRTPKKPERHIETLPKKRKSPPEVKKPRNVKKKELSFHSPDLPHDVLKHIFSYLQPLPTIVTCQRVCKYWLNYLSSNDPWQGVATLNFSQLRMERVQQKHIDLVIAKCPNLKHLVFSETVVDEELCKTILSISGLTHLTFAFCQFSNIPALASSLGGIMRLSLCSDMNRGPGLTLEELNTLVAGAKDLKELDFEWSKIREDLNKVPELSHLRLTGSHESFKSEIPSQYGLQLIAVYRKYDLSPNSHFFIQQMQRDLAGDWQFAHSAILLGLDANTYVNKENDTLLHLEMKKAEAIMTKWGKLRRDISAFHTFSPELLEKQKMEWENQVDEITSHIVFLLCHEASIKQKNSRKRSCLDMGNEIDNDISSVHFLQEDKPEGDEDDEDDVRTTIPIFPFPQNYFADLFDRYAIILPKKRRNRKIIKQKVVYEVENSENVDQGDEGDQIDQKEDEKDEMVGIQEDPKDTKVEEESIVEEKEEEEIILGDPNDVTHTYLK